MPKQRPILERTYRKFNRKYFGGRLPNPPDMDVRWGSIRGMGYQQGDEIVISRKDRRRDAVWQLTLLHEMAHAVVTDEKNHHGPKFQKEMMRLARLGAFHDLW